MKNIFKRNQVIITALVIMVIIAAYINFAGTKFDQEDLIAEANANVEEKVDTTDISQEDAVSTDDVNVVSSQQDLLNDSSEEAADTQDAALTEIPSLDSDADATQAAQTPDANTTDTPGEAVFTGASTNPNFASQAKLEREQVRAENKDNLLAIINNTNISDAQKQGAIDSMLAMTNIAEKENSAETLLESQGLSDVVVNITDNTVDVIVKKAELTDANRAKIEDIVKRKTGISVENIIITPME